MSLSPRQGVSWLYDKSGGKGQIPDSFPPTLDSELHGFAGGINPSNVIDIIKRISANNPYWIDMESGVRTDDWFDLDKCESVLKQIYEI